MRFLSGLASFLKNKYLLTSAGFVIWMLFFDRYDVFTQIQWRNELRAIRESKQYFTERIAEDRKFSNDIQYNSAAIEKYAREQYLMKKDNEDLFLVQPLQPK